MLAYAAQGLAGDEASRAGSELRDFLNRAAEALSGLAAAYVSAVKQENLQPAERYHAFLAVLERDAQDSLAAVELVLAQATPQLAINRQSKCLDPPPRAAHRFIPRR